MCCLFILALDLKEQQLDKSKPQISLGVENGAFTKKVVLFPPTRPQG